MNDSDAKLASLIGSRICHDLISPIGAINNGLELLSMTLAATGPELELISQSVQNASARIKFFRVAFGAPSPQSVGVSEAKTILRDYTKDSRIDIAYDVTEPQSRSDLRLVFLAVLCLENALAYGGTIDITHNDAAGWTLSAVADKLNIDEALWKDLCAGQPHRQAEPSQVQFILLPLGLMAARRTSHVQLQTSDITLQII